MARKKEKRREPYRKSNKWGKKGVIPFFATLIILALIILFIIILVKAPEICIPFTDKCWRLVPLIWSRGFIFWIAFFGFLLIQAGIIAVYWGLITQGIKYSHIVIAKIKQLTTNIERWFLRISA
jgi:hypothetical protein